MTDYREVARTARSYVLKGMEPRAAWDQAAARAFKNSPAKARNGIPRATFLGLCSAGLVKGVPPGTYAERAGEASDYAPRFVALLHKDPDYEDDPDILFTDATDGKVLKDNGQLDVVFGLWNHGLIEPA